MTDLDKLKNFIMTAQVAAEQGECLMPNITDVLNEIERLKALSLHNVVGRSEQLKAFLQEIESDESYIHSQYFKNKAKTLRERL